MAWKKGRCELPTATANTNGVVVRDDGCGGGKRTVKSAKKKHIPETVRCSKYPCAWKMRPEMVDSSMGSSAPIVLFAINTDEHLPPTPFCINEPTPPPNSLGKGPWRRAVLLNIRTSCKGAERCIDPPSIRQLVTVHRRQYLCHRAGNGHEQRFKRFVEWSAWLLAECIRAVVWPCS